jgi:hypothetical protein
MPLHSRSLTVRQDGTGDFTVIQNAINFSVCGDTIVVYPGRYLGMINFDGKNIHLTSRYHFSGDRNDIYNTILDGNSGLDQYSIVFFTNQESNEAVLNGFTLENGSNKNYQNYGSNNFGTVISGGGAITIEFSEPTIMNCIIQNNTSIERGGGVYIIAGLPHWGDRTFVPILSGNIIRYNSAMYDGGGIYFGSNSILILDEVNKNSVYANFASFGHDIFVRSNSFISFILDTFTVATNDLAFVDINSDYYFEATNSYLDECFFFDRDVYVDPYNGCDDNQGDTPLTAMKSLFMANYRLKSGSNITRNIFLAPGDYYLFESEHHFPPLGLMSNINIIGAGQDVTTIFSGQTHFHFRPRSDIEIKISGINFVGSVNPTNPRRYLARALIGVSDSLGNIEIYDCSFSRFFSIID